jgi:hypothetical protein
LQRAIVKKITWLKYVFFEEIANFYFLTLFFKKVLYILWFWYLIKISFPSGAAFKALVQPKILAGVF